MRGKFAQEKTVEFHFGSLTDQEPRSYDADEPTRELPLIAGRFAGREWTAETAVSEEKGKTRPGPAHPVFLLILCAAAAVALLIASLLGQARLVGMNEEAVALSDRISALRQEQETLLLRREETRPAAAWQRAVPDGESADDSGVPQPENPGEDRATVLNIRHGRELGHLWESLVDTLGASFH